MAEQTPTITIKVKSCPGNEEGVLIINASDFDPAKHERAGETAPGEGKSEKGEGNKKGKEKGKE